MSKTRTKYAGSMHLKQAYILSKQWGDPSSGENRKKIHEQGMKAYIPFRRERKWMQRFIYDPREDRIICVAGKQSTGKFPQDSGMLYYFSEHDCKSCFHYQKCVRQNQGRMTIWVSDNYKHKIRDDGEGRREALNLRKMIERKFGESKKWHRMDRARYRGREKVKIQVLMTFLILNIKRMVRLLEDGGQCTISQQPFLVPT